MASFTITLPNDGQLPSAQPMFGTFQWDVPNLNHVMTVSTQELILRTSDWSSYMKAYKTPTNSFFLELGFDGNTGNVCTYEINNAIFEYIKNIFETDNVISFTTTTSPMATIVGVVNNNESE